MSRRLAGPPVSLTAQCPGAFKTAQCGPCRVFSVSCPGLAWLSQVSGNTGSHRDTLTHCGTGQAHTNINVHICAEQDRAGQDGMEVVLVAVAVTAVWWCCCMSGVVGVVAQSV